MTKTTATVLELVPGNVVHLDGTDTAFVVEAVGRGLKVRRVTYRPAGGRSDDTFTITHNAGTLIEVVRA